ncbi:DEAD domain-containing protein/Helicase_C domain-containing protein [Cephalotus follicularis]|uniref:RNA helicase n=1 Tax=Cephalotus follicularis TaxID=3775 RepID=A0A1Q3B4J9_CEPFO|nr:DEAD domain-containing protein/Helicase_C domain-containing protein [Cephalotus follicularis]
MADTTSATFAPPPATNPTAVEPPKRWADEEDEAPEQPISTASAASSSYDKLAAELVEGLKVDEEEKINQYLEEPEESNITAVTSGDTPYTSASLFEDLNLSPELLKGIYVEMKFEKPSKIQAVTLPMILTSPYKDLIAQAHNGSGKTTCFVLGMLSRVDPKLMAPQALCICPTRELAMQNLEVLQKMGKYTGIIPELAVPNEKISVYKRGPVSAQVVIGTPGTIKKWMSLKKLGASYIKILVFDEADHMLAEDGFKDDSLRIMKDIERISSHCQVLLFSATFNETVKNFVSRVVKPDHNQVFVKKEELSLESVKQYKVNCPDERAKIMVVKDKIFEFGENLGQTIIFVRTKVNASMLHTELTGFGYEVTTIQGALKQEDRDRIVKEFKDGLTQVLISTDLLARGFDQQQVNLVINFDLPFKHNSPSEPDYEVYLHRIGRAGRFGRKGAVFNLLCHDRDHMLMSKIENHFGKQVTEVSSWQNVEDFKVALKEAGLL